MAHRGIGASFKLDSGTSPTTLTDISTYLDNISGSSSGETVDGTTFQPGVATPLKTEIPTFVSKGYSLSGKWTAAAEAFFSAVETLTDLNYEHGPTGTTTGMKKILGLCNCTSYSGPIQGVDGVITFTVELKVTTRSATAY